MELLVTLLVLIGLHAVFVSAEFAFVQTARSELKPKPEYFKSAVSAAICRQIEDYLTVCALARTIILMSIGVLLGLFLHELMNAGLMESAVHPWRLWAQFGLGFGGILIVQLIVGYEIPKVLALRRARDYTEVLGWHLVFSGIVLWPLLWLVNYLKRLTYRFA